MVNIRKRKKGNKEYYYLEHSYREGKKVRKKEKYLGSKVPQDIEDIKKKFISEIYKEQWFNSFDLIKKNYSKEQKILPKSLKEKQTENFMIRFTYNTQRIEGSTLTLKETADLLERGTSPKGKPIRDAKEAEAHKEVFYEMSGHKGELTNQIVLKWNRDLLKNTKPDIAGKIRKHQVLIARSKFVPPIPAELDFLLKEFFDWYGKHKSKVHPLELSALVHLKFVTIHPFGDGNGRISRIMMNFALNKHNFPMLDIPYSRRTGYYNALERSQVKKDETIFVHWFFRNYLKINKKYLKGDHKK
ncbi:MAG: Fic family protein [Nanoarchaeota archaeon]|nr:Fic family protein [Nanoarchaeota archaeon]